MKSRVFFLPLFFLLIAANASAADSLTVTYARHGVSDLRNTGFKAHKIAMKGEWAFYWQHLLLPGSLASAKPAYIAFPALWKSDAVNGHLLPSKGYATYALTVLLPHNHEPLAVKIPDVYSSYRFYINGSLIAENGVPSTTAAETKPRWANTVCPVPDNTDTLQITWQMANFSHAKGGANETIIIGDRNLLVFEHEESIALDFLLTGCLFMGGLFFFGLYLFGRFDKTILFFSLFCMVYSYRIIGADPYSLHNFLPATSWWITIRIEYISLYLSSIFFMLYVRNLYKAETNSRIIFLLNAVSYLLILATIILPSAFFTLFINPFLILAFFSIGYTLYIFIRAAQHKRTGSAYSLASALVLTTVFVYINFGYLEMYTVNQQLVMAGYIIFFFLQSLILSYRFAYNLKQAKRQAIKASKAKTQFLSTMSHEIRTPLNAVIGLAHFMLKNNPRNDQKEELEIMLFSANNLLCIVNDILDFDKIEAGKIHFEYVETNLQEITKNIAGGFKTYALDKGISLLVTIDEALDVTIKADPTRTSQVLTNLVHNAIKFTAKGSVTLSVKVTARTEHTITLLFSVKDTGMGIPQQKQELVFDRFTQADSSTSRSFGGTGLGLSICKGILEKQGSNIQLKSSEEHGSEFYFTQTFPICNRLEKKPEQFVQETGLHKPLDGIGILLVEDSEMNVLVASRFLESWGAEIEVALNGREAIEKFNEAKHKLVLMDLHMPVMDGRDATVELRKTGTKVPIIALTASIFADENQKVLACGANDIVLKPFEPESLRIKLLHYLRIAY